MSKRSSTTIQPPRAKRRKPAAGSWPLLHNTEAKDAHLCTVGKGGPSCYIVQNAVRVLGNAAQAAGELGITPAAAAQALDYAAKWPRKPSDEERELLAHAAAVLFAGK